MKWKPCYLGLKLEDVTKSRFRTFKSFWGGTHGSFVETGVSIGCLTPKTDFLVCRKTERVSFWRKIGTRASNFEASSNLTFEKTSFSNNEIKRELALAFQTEFFLTWVAGSERIIFQSSPESRNMMSKGKLCKHICATIFALLLPQYQSSAAPIFKPLLSLPLEFSFRRVLSSAIRIVPQFRPRVDETVFVHFLTRSSFLLPIRFSTTQLGEFELWIERFFSPPARP